ncbi:hypothetical protein H4219_002460 [Mycoemilia scoparia]|uniref:BZIP domain-containing protein n=1 Tax=Mycoemilia scoparia TaxID=417184 RepID=A0A9W8DQI9_9FUNG|nr:hypothetical protein H4219_002460 [Mycoemilia scoparia]
MSINSPIAHVASLSRSVTPDSLNSDGENSDNNSSMTNSPTLSHSSGFSLNSPLRSPLGQSSSHKENGNGSLGSPLGKNKRSRKSQNHVLERRRERNREAAKRSRHRQQKRAEELERRCNILKNTEIEMNRKLNLLKRFNDYPPDKVVCLEGRKRNLVEIDECVDYLMYQLTYLDLQIQYLITNVVTFNQERIECTTMYDRGEDVTFPTVVGYLSPDPSCGLKPHELFALQQKQKEAANGSNDLSSQNIPPHNSDGTDKNSALSTKSASPTATTKS